MSKEKNKRRIRQAAAAAAALLLAAAFTFPLGTDMSVPHFGNAIVASAETSADDFEISDNGDNTVTITKYNGFDVDIVIPGTIGGKTVISIGEFAFFFHTNITSITIPNSVTSIENSAFVNCASLESITIPNSVTSIGNDVFFIVTTLKA